MDKVTLKEPHTQLIDQFFLESLQKSATYKIDVQDCPIKIDQNESPWDWPEELKQKILNQMTKVEWNRYPAAFDEELNELIAGYAGVESKNILTGPGSNYLITLLLTTLTQKISGKVIIARPSFPLYESHCHYENIPYEVWLLNQDLEYDLNLLPQTPPGSLIVFASPNNPVGNALSIKDLTTLLREHPSSLILADEAYFEFVDEPYTPLLAQFPNLLLLRTFSKTMGAASLRIGYLIAHERYINELKKLRLPFLLNSFSLIAAKEILNDPEMKAFRNKVVALALSERERLFVAISKMTHLQVQVQKPHANFLLLKFPSQDICLHVYQQLIARGILVRNVSGGPGLTGCLRASVGTEEENSQLLNSLESIKIYL